jgi:hypothetical protein
LQRGVLVGNVRQSINRSKDSYAVSESVGFSI